MYIVGKYQIDLHSLRNGTEKPFKGSFVCLFLMLVQINVPFPLKRDILFYCLIYCLTH